MKLILSLLLLLYLVGLHSSIALMEVFSWATFACVVGYKLKARSKFDWPLFFPMALLVGTVLVSLLVVPLQKPFWFQMGFMRWTVLFYSFYWALDLVWSERFEFHLLSLWNLVIAVASLYAFVQCFTGIDIIRPGVQRVVFDDWGTYKSTGYFAMKATSFFSLSLTFAYVLGISMFSALRPSLANVKLRPWAWGARVAALGGIFATQSRGAWISVALCGLISFVVTYPRRLLMAALAAAAAVTMLFFAHHGVHDKLMALSQKHLDHSSLMRVDLWRAYLQMFREHPWFGIGLLQGDKLLPEYYAKLGIVQPFVSHAHNVYLQWGAGAGVFALLLYLWISFMMLRQAWQLRQYSAWGLALFLGQLSMHFGAFTECNFFDGEVLHMVVFAWALTTALRTRHLGKAQA